MKVVARYAALAVAHRTSNAVGPVVFTLDDAALRLEFAGVRPHLRGFALGGEAVRVTLEVPYAAVRGIVREGRVLLVSFDPRVLYPYNRFALVQFRRAAVGDGPSRASLARGVAFASWFLPFSLAVLTGVFTRLVGAALLSRGVAAVAVALAVRFAVRALGRRILWGGAASDRLRDELEAALAERLGLGDRAARVVALADTTDGIDDALATVSRPRRLGPALALAVVGLLAAGSAVQRYGITRVVRLPVPDAHAGLGTGVPSLLAASRAAVRPTHPECGCDRADSPLWLEPPPRVVLLVTPIIGELDAMRLTPEVVYHVKPGPRERVEFDLALVNGASVSLPEATLVLTFWRRDGNDRRAIIERGLSWPHVLKPGDSVKWRVRAKGDALRITSYLPAAVEQQPYAIADVFAKLDRANVAAVRLHGATMLAYLGDARAFSAANALGALSPLEEPSRAALALTLEPWAACEVRDGGVCVFNRTARLARSVELRDAVGRTNRVTDLFFPGRGVRVPFEGATSPVVIAR